MELKTDPNADKVGRIELIMSLLDYKTVKEFAKAIQVSPSYLSEMLSGKKSISKILGQRIEDNLLVSRKWFETGEGDIWLVNERDRQQLEPISSYRKPDGLTGETLREVRNEYKMSIDEFARALEVSEEDVVKYESSKKIKDQDYINKVGLFIIKEKGLDKGPVKEASLSDELEQLGDTLSVNWPVWVILLYTGLTPEQYSDRVGVDIDRIERAIMRGNNVPLRPDQLEIFLTLQEKLGEGETSDNSIAELVADRRKQFNQSRELVDYNTIFSNTMNLRGHYIVFANLIKMSSPGKALAREDIITPTEEIEVHAVTMNIAPFGRFLSVEILGKNMENYATSDLAKESIQDGSIVTGRDVPKRYWTELNRMKKLRNVILITHDKILINRIKEYRHEKGTYLLESLNPNKEEFPDTEISLDTIRHLLYIFKKEPPGQQIP